MTEKQANRVKHGEVGGMREVCKNYPILLPKVPFRARAGDPKLSEDSGSVR